MTQSSSTPSDFADHWSQLAPRVRPDLQWIRQEMGDVVRWIARDPLTFNFFYFDDREKRVLELFDGHRDLRAITRYLNRENTHALHESDLGGFVARLERCNLLLLEGAAQPRRLAQRFLRQRSSWVSALVSPLSIRVPLFDPRPWLGHLAPLGRIFFSLSSVVLLLLTWLFLGVWMLGRWSELAKLVPLPQEMLEGNRLVILFCAYILVKSLHEVGHALACQRFGAECHEIGLYFLVFTPCMYCDVTDSWKLKNRFHRAWIALAGMHVELVIAAFSAVIWITAQPGTLSYLAFSMLAICSVSTLLVNGNPLLRYDGYYVLSDLWGVPNLAEQAREALFAPLRNWLTGAASAERQSDGGGGLLLLYAFASLIYRTLLLALILWGVHKLLKPLGLQVLANWITLTALLGVALTCTRNLSAGLRWMRSTESLRPYRAAALACVAATSIMLLLFLPLPKQVAGVAVVRDYLAEPIYAKQTGRLIATYCHHEFFAEGDTLAQFDAPQRQLELIQLQGEVAQLRSQAELLNLQVVDDPDAERTLAAVKETLESKTRQVRLVEEDLESLTVIAPRAGCLYQPPERPPTVHQERQLPGWTKTPLAPENLGATIERGELLGWLGDARVMHLEALLSERDAELVRIGTQVRGRLDQHTRVVFEGVVERVSADPIDVSPQELIGDARLVSVLAADGAWHPERPTFRVFIKLKASLEHAPLGSLATVHIEAAPMTVAARVMRFLRQTFSLDQ